MDFFDFEEASHAIPHLDHNDISSSIPNYAEMDEFSQGVQAAKAELEAQRAQHPNPFSNTRKFGTIIKLKLINNCEVEGILWDQKTDYPMFRAKQACELCARTGLDCFLASRGALITGCTCCISLYRECSFTHGQMPKGFRATFPGIAEDAQVCHGPMTEATRNMRSFEDAKSRKTGSRFPRDAVKILKKWLSEHADHPYPNEREKDDLKNLTGLKRSQISNWLANARRRGKVRLPSGPSSPMLGAIDIPSTNPEVMADLNPLDRWKASPPEHEPALMTDIARAITTVPTSRNGSCTSLHNSRSSSRKASSEEDSNWSAFRAPSVSSFETRDSTNSDFSFASSKSQQSKLSHASSQERRRRRRAPVTQRAANQAIKSRNARIFQCTFCTDTFPSKYDWQRHEKSLHLALERWTCCPDGGTVTMSETGQDKCAFCPKMDPSDSHLETHNFSACHEKTLQERTFFRKDHLRQHLRLMHDVKFDPSMESWKSTNNEIKSKCGICPSHFTTWQQRADHLAAHFRNGADMARWTGNWGFEPHIERLVGNAIPPYLIGHERSTMIPFVARGQHESAMTPGLSTGTSADDSERVEPDQITRDTNCWHRLEQELTKYVMDQKVLGVIPTDKQIQDQARIVIYGDPDPIDWTCAENPTWLEAFKFQTGIGPAPVDVPVPATTHVPIMAPYVIKGGLKNKQMNQGVSCLTSNMNSLQQSPHEDIFEFPPVRDLDHHMELDFDNIDFGSLDLPGVDGLTFNDTFGIGPIHTGMGGTQYAPAQIGKNMFGSFGVSIGEQESFIASNQQIMNEHDLDQLTGYVAGFP
jgi:hypothetical protein